MKPFWMLYAEGRGLPVHKHETELQARLEAEQLAKEFHIDVYVLEAIARCEIVAVKWEEQEAETDVGGISGSIQQNRR